MGEGKGYGQFCPAARAAEYLAMCWTPLIMWELICGSSHFNEIHRDVPLVPRALLSKRQKELQGADVVENYPRDAVGNAACQLTSAGEELRPTIISMGAGHQR